MQNCDTNRKNIREMLQDIAIGKEFLSNTPKAHKTKAKKDKQGYIKLNAFCTAKENNQQ